MEVCRRFSDFLGLHEKLVVKHLHQGRIIPPAPEKSVIGEIKKPNLCNFGVSRLKTTDLLTIEIGKAGDEYI